MESFGTFSNTYYFIRFVRHSPGIYIIIEKTDVPKVGICKWSTGISVTVVYRGYTIPIFQVMLQILYSLFVPILSKTNLKSLSLKR